MKSAVVYYSYSGNTRAVAWKLSEILRERGEVEEINVAATDEPANFLARCNRAITHAKANIITTGLVLDLSDYDLICFGSPVWAFSPAPAMNAYIDQCRGVINKSVILFTTYGSGSGNERCLNYMQKLLAKKGVVGFKRFSIQQTKVKDSALVISKIKEVLNSPLR